MYERHAREDPRKRDLLRCFVLNLLELSDDFGELLEFHQLLKTLVYRESQVFAD